MLEGAYAYFAVVLFGTLLPAPFCLHGQAFLYLLQREKKD
jgi:hypothetical protein